MTRSCDAAPLIVTGQRVASAGLNDPSAPLELMSSGFLSVEELMSLASEGSHVLEAGHAIQESKNALNRSMSDGGRDLDVRILAGPRTAWRDEPPTQVESVRIRCAETIIPW